jgi:prepilin-type N-terminal cleavage/methylation domain-containing protein
MQTKGTRGFTLIELLVVIAIIGILSSVVLASLSTARKKGRDARRVSDLKQLSLALELYADANSGKYPTTAAAPTAIGTGGPLVTGGFISTVPSDPSNNANAYGYVATSSSCDNTTTNCTGYFLGATLEVAGQSGPLANDTDANAAITIGGTATNCNANAGAANEDVYCVSN